jgi:N-acetylmuramoyl-L-alanine amidase
MRKINKIIVHCSDSDIAGHDDISVVDGWHRARGWQGVGYHYFIQSSGNVQKGREESEQGAHVAGHNSDSIGICLHGRRNFTPQQFHALKALLYDLMIKYDLFTKDVYGHNDFDKRKTCPNFDVKKI